VRIAFFSPLPPAKSGIADYSAALVESLRTVAAVDTFTERPATFDPSGYDISVYQIGNNPFHSVPYEMALDHPGVVVLHEANLHHLIADLTIRRNDWDAYLREVEFDGGPEALAYAEQYVRTLLRGPDYDGVPMLRRLAQRSRGFIVHSNCVAEELLKAGFEGPISRIWHGAWITDPDRNSWRERLGVDESAPLIGIFGFLKPYKRIAESLRAFRRLVTVEPRARMILAGEPHPELRLDSLIDTLKLAPYVRLLGFTPIDDFNGYLGACDIVLNLRYPTVGESSGTLLRALGMGKAVIVSDVGSFREYPDDILLKAPTGITEEDHLFEYLNLLVSRPDLARNLGANARAWVARECSWDTAARQYLAFLEQVTSGAPPPPVTAPEPVLQAANSDFTADIRSWTDPAAQPYVDSHITRLNRTLQLTPPGERILEMGAYLQITPILRSRLKYREVRGCYFGPAGRSEYRKIVSAERTEFECAVDLFDAERDAFPYPDDYFCTVLCGELIEHLASDPMHMLAEINRVLRSGGHLVLTTPNIVSVRSAAGILQGYQPGLFTQYIRPRSDGRSDARHNREYTPREVSDLLVNSGFEVVLLETGPFLDQLHPEYAWVGHLLDRYMLPADLRGDGIYAVGRKTGPIRERYPSWLYS
jgi:glycosyltransferase involved in cell wall biosynthesis/SAM-dependent methyltransferase